MAENLKKKEIGQSIKTTEEKLLPKISSAPSLQMKIPSQAFGTVQKTNILKLNNKTLFN